MWDHLLDGFAGIHDQAKLADRALQLFPRSLGGLADAARLREGNEVIR
jgi:hypothetical protein